MAETSFFMQLQYLEHEEEMERTLFLFPRRRAGGALPPQERLAGLEIRIQSMVRGRGGRKRRRCIPYRVAAIRPLGAADGPRQGRALWLTPTGPLARQLELLARGDDAEGKRVDIILLRWPDGGEERYERAATDSKTFVRAA